MILAGQELVAGGGGMRTGKQGDGAVVIVDAGCHSVLRGQIDRLLGLENAAQIGQIRVDHGDGLLFQQILEALGQVNVLAGADRRRAGILESAELVGVEPRHHVFVPGQVVLIQSPRELDKGLDGKVAVVVRGDRNFIADNTAHRFTVVRQPIQCFVGEERRGEQVLAVGVIGAHRDLWVLAARRRSAMPLRTGRLAVGSGAGRVYIPTVLPCLAGDLVHPAGPQVHLAEGPAGRDPFLQMLPIVSPVGLLVVSQ